MWTCRDPFLFWVMAFDMSGAEGGVRGYGRRCKLVGGRCQAVAGWLGVPVGNGAGNGEGNIRNSRGNSSETAREAPSPSPTLVIPTAPSP